MKEKTRASQVLECTDVLIVAGLSQKEARHLNRQKDPPDSSYIIRRSDMIRPRTFSLRESEVNCT